MKLETVSVPSSFFVFFGLFKDHLSRKRSEQHGPLESDSDTCVPELGLPTNTDQNPEFQEWNSGPRPGSQQNLRRCLFLRDPPPSRQPAWLYKPLKTTPVAQHWLWKWGPVEPWYGPKKNCCVFAICSKLKGNLSKFYSYKEKWIRDQKCLLRSVDQLPIFPFMSHLRPHRKGNGRTAKHQQMLVISAIKVYRWLFGQALNKGHNQVIVAENRPIF